MISRAERSAFSRLVRGRSIAGCSPPSLLLMVLGLVFAMAGSPPVAERLALPTFHFVNRQVLYLRPGAGR